MTHPQLAVRRAVAAIESGTSVNAMDFPSAEDEVGVLKTSCVSNGFFDATENKVVDPDEIERASCPVRSDRLIVSRMNTPALVGAAGHTERDYDNLYLPDRLWQVRTSEAAVARFVYWWMQTREYRDQVAAICVGTSSSMQNLSQNDFRSFQMPYPSHAIQSAISDFLDRETAQIDELIGKQERLIELLAEKRQAIIAHAVTKGLDPTAPTKPSGIHWLGDVADHWRVAALKHFLRIPISDGPHETPEFLDEGVPFVSAEAVSGGVINFSKIRGFISPTDNKRYSQKYSPRRGDIYMVKSGATTGVTALVETDEEFNIWSPLAAIRCDDTVLPQFLLAFLRSGAFLDSVALHWSFGTQQNIGMGVLGDLPVAVPPIAEQHQIAEHLGRKFKALDHLQSRCIRSIELLKERRSALISAAVTGKINVTNEGAAG